MLGNDAVEVLGPRRPAFDIPRVLVTVLVAQHRGLEGRVGASLYLGGLADDVTALTRVLRSLYHHFLRTLPSPYNRLSKRRATLLMTPRRLHGDQVKGRLHAP